MPLYSSSQSNKLEMRNFINRNESLIHYSHFSLKLKKDKKQQPIKFKYLSN